MGSLQISRELSNTESSAGKMLWFLSVCGFVIWGVSLQQKRKKSSNKEALIIKILLKKVEKSFKDRYIKKQLIANGVEEMITMTSGKGLFQGEEEGKRSRGDWTASSMAQLLDSGSQRTVCWSRFSFLSSPRLSFQA